MEREEDTGEHIPPRRRIPHYHGDETRVVFFISALILIVAQSTGADLPLTTTGTVIAAVLLVVTAGVTSPAQSWIHWLNAFLAAYGTIIFGMTAVERYRSDISFLEASFVYVEVLALLSLVALYFTTRTIRGLFQREKF